MRHIGIAGKAGSGKDSLAAYLAGNFFGMKQFMFADSLKRMICDQYGYDFDRLNNDPEYKEEQDPNLPEGFTRRVVLQDIGSAFRAIKDTHWVDKAMDAAEAARKGAHGQQVQGMTALFTDVRYPNEVAAIMGAGGIVIKMECPDRPTSTDSTGHSSEAMVDQLTVNHVISCPFGQLTKAFVEADKIMAAEEFARINVRPPSEVNIIDRELTPDSPSLTEALADAGGIPEDDEELLEERD